MFAVERRFPEGEAHGLPMNSCDDTHAEQRLTDQRGESARAGERRQVSGQCGANQQAVGVVVIDRDGCPIDALPHAKRIAPFHSTERRYVQHFPAGERCVGGDRRVVARTEQIAVALTEGVAHFGEQRAERSAAVVAEPEADRVERVTEHARKRLQPDLAVRFVDARCGELSAHQRREIAAVARTVIASIQT